MGKVLHTLAIIVATAVAFSSAAHLAVKDEDPYALPETFLIGAGVSAIQTEGAWDADGKKESSPDHLLHTGKLAHLGFQDPHQHDVAADSYHRYMDDVKMAKALGLQLYRFSVSWGRVFFEGARIEKGIQYYHDLIKAIKDNGMQPLITLYHFDHPQQYEDDFMGWQSDKMVPKFEEYAKFMFQEYGKEVDLWVTMNEPNMYCAYFPSMFVEAGLYKEEDANIYRCMRNLILAHARSYHAFKDAGISGQIGFTALLMHASPNSTAPEDVYAADLFNQVHAGQVLAPVVLGDYPQVLKDELSDKLTEFTPEEKELIRGTTDFIGFNVYFSMVAAWQDPSSSAPFFKIPIMGKLVEDLPPSTYVNIAGEIDIKNPMNMFTRIAPEAIRDAVLWVWNSYKKPIIITENGLGDSLGMGKKDHLRASYHSAYMRTLVSTMKVFKVDVFAYCAWSLIDSFEWSAGFGRPFGLVHVDFEGKTLDRSLKESSQFWIELAKKRVVPLVEEPITTTPGPPASSTSSTSSASSTPSTSSASSLSTFLLLPVGAVLITLKSFH
ncbi:myrosinase 1 [Frankliniella occidentalis]|uniref:Myrosinase 1 n=1 Tax=Frankliniella occidentalis TaxID=133901 RepID=A0A6J1SER5_FRAOC|nr:myrosinase 1 [Frankliniella occidentalis]